MDDCADRERWMPFPELVDEAPGAYRIIDSADLRGLPSNGMADKQRRILWVPLNAGGRPVSLHELAHVRWSPRRYPRPDFCIGFLQAVEDARINLGLEAAGLPLEFGAEARETVLALARDDLERDDPVMATLRAIASFGTDVEPDLAGLLAGGGDPLPGLLEVVREVRARLERARPRRADVVPFGRGLRIARWLAGELERRGFPPREERRLLLVGCGHGHAGAARGTVARLLERLGRAVDAGGEGSAARPGRLSVATPPLPHRCAPPPATARRRWRATDEGTAFRDLSRYVVDRRIFRRRARGGSAGGSVLIDVSGSMRLARGDVDRIIQAAPAATTVAIYSGRGDVGELRVVVSGGFRADREQLEPYGGGNVVDLPALEWLAQQRAPRVWISDGGVTGCGDRASAWIDQACRRLCRRAAIVRVANAREASEVLAGRGVARGAGEA